MLPLRTEKGKFYIGNLEVKAEEVFLGLEANVAFKTGEVPGFETVLVGIVNDGYNAGINLLDANAYRLFVLGEMRLPEMNVPDGKVLGETKRKIVVDFYKVQPVHSIRNS